MNIRKSVALFVFLSTTAFANENDEASKPATNWRFGTASVNITPETPMLMSGYASRETPATGKLTDLWAKALVLEDAQGARCVIVTVDLVGISAQVTKHIRRALLSRYQLRTEELVICCSHTHTGPAIAGTLAPMNYSLASPRERENIDRYTSLLRSKIVVAVHKAIKNMEAGTLTWGNGAATFATNRRENNERMVPQLRVDEKLTGPHDHDVPVLAILNEAEELKVIVFGYACHATVLSSFQWSGDYPGFAQIELEKAFPGCMAMFWAGCGADQNPLPRRTTALAQHYGKRLALAVESVLLTHQLQTVTSELHTSYCKIPLSFGAVPTTEDLEAEANSEDRFVSARAKLLQERIETHGKLPRKYDYPISVWELGEIEWIFLGGEVVVDYALRLKSERAAKRTWVCGYANDVMAYIPSERVLREGRYEGASAMIYYGLQSPWAPGLENQILATVDELTNSPATLSDVRVPTSDNRPSAISN